MRSLKSRFILSHILPIIIVIPLAGIALIYLIETQILLKDMAEDLTESAEIMAAAISRHPDGWSDPETTQSIAQSFALVIDGQLLVIGRHGELLGSNNPELLGQIGQQQQLEGINQALEGDINILLFYGFFSQGAEVLFPVTDVEEELVGVIALSETLEGVGPFFNRLRWFVLGLLAVELVVGVIVALILASRLEKPIASAASAVIEVSKGQDIDPLEPSGPEEIQRLSQAVNILSERLRLLEETRKHLLANLVHELGRPLGAIRAAIHVLRQGAVEDDATRDELLEGIEDEVTRLEPLLDDLAQLHGAVLGQVTLDRRPTNLNRWLPSIILPWRAAALEKGLKWFMDIPPNLPELNLDSDRMSQVIGNLLSNGIKYTEPGGDIALKVADNKSEILIIVADSGYGVVSDEQEKIFEPFYRSSQDRRFPQGMGLGLTIARDLVEAHGGTLEIGSEKDKGSRFIINLPLSGEMILDS